MTIGTGYGFDDDKNPLPPAVLCMWIIALIVLAIIIA